jgi:hypothetical protein
MRFGGFGLGVLAGAAFASFGAALAHDFGTGGFERGGGDHYAMGWSLLVRGELICRDPYVRPGEHELECRLALPAMRGDAAHPKDRQQ